MTLTDTIEQLYAALDAGEDVLNVLADALVDAGVLTDATQLTNYRPKLVADRHGMMYLWFAFGPEHGSQRGGFYPWHLHASVYSRLVNPTENHPSFDAKGYRSRANAYRDLVLATRRVAE